MYIDTSSLFKKYFQEDGSTIIIDFFKKSTEVFVSSITYIEVMNSVYRYYKDRFIFKKALDSITGLIHRDFICFTEIPIDEKIRSAAHDIMKKKKLKSLDLIHLSSAQVSGCHRFVTSDKKLYKVAKACLSCEVCLV